jgi:hypothetical protein
MIRNLLELFRSDGFTGAGLVLITLIIPGESPNRLHFLKHRIISFFLDKEKHLKVEFILASRLLENQQPNEVYLLEGVDFQNMEVGINWP